MRNEFSCQHDVSLGGIHKWHYPRRKGRGRGGRVSQKEDTRGDKGEVPCSNGTQIIFLYYCCLLTNRKSSKLEQNFLIKLEFNMYVVFCLNMQNSAFYVDLRFKIETETKRYNVSGAGVGGHEVKATRVWLAQSSFGSKSKMINFSLNIFPTFKWFSDVLLDPKLNFGLVRPLF